MCDNSNSKCHWSSLAPKHKKDKKEHYRQDELSNKQFPRTILDFRLHIAICCFSGGVGEF